MMDVFFYEAFAEEEQALKRHLPPGVEAGFTWKTIQETGDELPPASVISLRTQSVIPPEWASKMTGILSRSTGYDHLSKYQEQCGSAPQCGYLPLYCNRSVAEQALMLWLGLLRKLPLQQQNFRNFQRDGLTGRECVRKVLLVVGVGSIGFELVQLGRALGMEVLGVDLVERHPSVDYVSIEDGLARADIIVGAMNLTSANHAYFNYSRLSRVRPGALFVNVARGELTSAPDLLRLLNEGILGGVALDVYAHESLLAVSLRQDCPSDDEEVQAVLKLAACPNVILTPHNAFNTVESVERKSAHSVQQLEHLREHGCFLWPVPATPV
jgi:D-lactate dehydrogenase